MGTEDRPPSSIDLADVGNGYRFSHCCTSKELGVQAPGIEVIRELYQLGFLDENESLKVKLALQEAVANALEHGNLELPSSWREEIDEFGIDRFSRERAKRLEIPSYADRLIQISLEVADNTLIIVVEDEGNGFEQTPPRVGEGEVPTVCYGRGLNIMNKVMDEVEYSKGGRRLNMKKTLHILENSHGA